MRRYMPWIIPVTAVIIWQLAADSGRWSSYVLPAPMAVAIAMWRMIVDGSLLHHTVVSLARVVGGFLVAAVTAIPLAALLGLWAPAHRLLGGTVSFFRHVPPLALLPLLILWLGIGEASKTAVVFLATFYPIFMNALTGFRNTDMRLLEMGRQYGLSQAELILRIRLPYAIPYIFTGLRIGLGYSWRSLIGAEMIAAASGIGYLVLEAQAMAQSARVLVGVIVIGVSGMILDTAVSRVGHRVWRRYLEGDGNGDR